jgi:hypothetical protein
MPRVSPIQESFSAGEISRNVRGRVSSEVYKNGLAEARNWMPTVQGPIRLRNGSKFLNTVDPANWVSGNTSNIGIRTFTFSRGLGEDVLIEIGTEKVVPKNGQTGGDVIQGDTPNLVPNSDYSAGLDQWIFDKNPGFFRQNPNTTTAEPSIFGAFDIFAPPDQPLEAINAGTPEAYWNISAVAVGDQDTLKMGALRSGSAGIVVPTGLENATATLKSRWGMNLNEQFQFQGIFGGDVSNWKWKIDVGSTPGGSDVFSQNFDIPGNQVFVDTEVTFSPAGNNLLYLSVGFTYIGPVDIPDQLFNFNGWVGVQSITIQVPAGTGLPIDFPSPWNSAQLECLNMAHDPGEGLMVFTHKDVPTYYLDYNGGLWDFARLDSHPDYQNPFPNTWIDGNWPRACAFHEGRLYLGGSNFDRSTIWASRSGNYFDFNNNNPDSKDDPLLFPLSSSGTIQTLTSRKELVINTDISEVVGDSVDGVIAFDDFSFPKQTDWGANCIQPVVMGRSMVYTSNSKRIIRTFADEGGTNYGWDGVELNLLAEDIFRVPVRQMAFMDEPSYQAAFLLADGTLGMATFYYPEDVIGWWRFRTAFNGSGAQDQNRIMSISSVDTETGSKLWLTINRVGFPGTLLPTHELMSFDRDSIVALDSWSFRNISSSGIISDVDHLTDQDVSIVVQQQDENTNELSWTVHPKTVSVVAGVTTPLEEWAWGSIAYIGLRYDNAFELLPVEGVANRGTAQVTKRRWNQIYLRLNRSAVPLVNGEPPKDRTPSTPMGRGEPIVSEDLPYSELGSNNKGKLLVTQDKPLITEVVAIFGKVSAREV